MRWRKITTRSARPSSGSTRKRRNMKPPTPIWSSRYFTKAKFMPHAIIVATAAASDQSKIGRFMKPENLLAARAAVRALTASKIRELYNAGIGNPNVLPFWVGEPDEPTPEFIRKAGTASIAAGELFYTHNLGIAELREALASYISKLRRRVDSDQIAVTTAGVNALMVASQLLVDPGDRVVQVVPLWPNLQEIPKILGATVETVPLQFSEDGWKLPLEKLLDELKPKTRALYLNSPNNPTGWTVSEAELKAILERCRKHGIWVFADDAYER